MRSCKRATNRCFALCIADTRRCSIEWPFGSWTVTSTPRKKPCTRRGFVPSRGSAAFAGSRASGPGSRGSRSISAARTDVARRARLGRSPTFCPVVKTRRSSDRIDLGRAIAQLPDGYRDVFVLYDVEGYSHNEISRLLGIAVGTCKSQLSRARHAMRRLLAAPAANGSPVFKERTL